MKTREKTLIGIIVFVITNVIINYALFIVKGSYPTEMFIALIPPIMVEFWIIYKLGLEDKKNDNSSKCING